MIKKKTYTEAEVEADEKKGIWHTCIKVKKETQAIKNLKAIVAKYEAVS